MEDYKQKYEQALENIKKIKVANKSNKELVDFIEYKYPELKESEDERIKNEIIAFVEQSIHRGGGTLVPQEQEDKWIAWLEKQGEIKRSDYPYVTGWRENRPDNKPKIKHSILMLTTHGVAEGEWLGEEWCQYRWSCKVKDEDVLYWLHLSDLETLEKENVKRDFSWLEKQGEHKCDCKYVGCYVNDVKRWCHKKQAEILYEKCNIECSKYLKQGEQKPTDKVEPKFHEGEWITIKE